MIGVLGKVWQGNIGSSVVYIYIMGVCVTGCVCVRERGSVSECVRVGESECVCHRVSVCLLDREREGV